MKIFSIEYVLNENGNEYTFEVECKNIKITDDYLEYTKLDNQVVKIPFKRNIKDISIIELSYRK